MKKWRIKDSREFERCIEYPIAGLNDETFINEYYGEMTLIPKKNGFRQICKINKQSYMYQIQKKLKKNFLDNIYLADNAYGFVPKKSYLGYLSEHERVSPKCYLHLDIEDFFGSINSWHIEKAFGFYVEGEDRKDILDALNRILLYDNKLVQGTPIAPVVSNIVFRPLDIRIERYCNKLHVTYTRYADDLLFSSETEIVKSKRFTKTIEHILKSYFFRINRAKTKRSNSQLSLNGYVVENGVRLSRKKISRVTKLLFYLESKPYVKDAQWLESFCEFAKLSGYKSITSEKDIVNTLAGQRSFLIAAKRASNDVKFINRSQKVIHRIEKQINILNGVKEDCEKINRNDLA